MLLKDRMNNITVILLGWRGGWSRRRWIFKRL